MLRDYRTAGECGESIGERATILTYLYVNGVKRSRLKVVSVMQISKVGRGWAVRNACVWVHKMIRMDRQSWSCRNERSRNPVVFNLTVSSHFSDTYHSGLLAHGV